MPKPRYDEEENISRHMAADEACCEEMEQKYGWDFVRTEESGNSVLEVDCVFAGKTEFPKSFQDKDDEDDDA
jgi:hypothetical protein